MRNMRLEKREIKDTAGLRSVLEECQVVRIGACDADGVFVVPMNFGYEFFEEDRRLKLYLHSAKEGRKAEAFAQNPAVAFEMDCGHALIRGENACNYSYAYRSLMGSGTIRRIEEPKEKNRAMQLLMHHMDPQAEAKFSPEMLERVAVYCIDVTEFTGKRRA